MVKFYSNWKTYIGAFLFSIFIFPINTNATVHEIPSDADSLEHFIETDYDTAWFAGDTIMLIDNEYTVNNVISIYRTITIMGDPNLPAAPVLNLEDNGFRVEDDTLDVTFNYFDINGLQTDGDYSPYFLYYNTLGGSYFGDIVLEDMDISGFKYMLFLDAAKHSVYDSLIIDDVIVHDFEATNNWNFVIDPKINYLKYMSITNSTFYNLPLGFLKNPDYNGNGTLDITKDWTIDHCTFYKVGANGKSFIQINDPSDGSVDFTFTNNIISKMYDTTSFKPIFINESAGDFYFGYSSFNNYEVEHYTDYNLSTVASYSNIDTSHIYFNDPSFADTTTYDFTLSDTSYTYSAGTDGGPIGDPRWAEKITKVVSISALLETVITGNDYQLEVTVNAGDSISVNTVTWTVLNGTGEATINSSGVLSAVSAGTVTAIATSNYKSIYADSLDITINDSTYVESISLKAVDNDLEEQSVISNTQIDNLIITASVSPGAATNDSVTWTISNDSLATFTVLSAKKIELEATGKGCGYVTITATATDGSDVYGTIEIGILEQIIETSIAVSAENEGTSVSIGNTIQLYTTYEPITTCVQSGEWYSSKTSIATVDSNGLVTGVAAGSTTINYRSSHATYATFDIEVTETSAVSDIETNSISVYPNPAIDVLNIASEKSANVYVTNIVGSIVLYEIVEPNSSINISELESGIYFVNIESNNTAKTFRIIKQ